MANPLFPSALPGGSGGSGARPAAEESPFDASVDSVLEGLDAPAVSAGPDRQRRGYPGYGGADESGEHHLSDYLRVLVKRRWSVLTVFLVIVLSVVTYTFTATPVFEAGVQILIENQDPNVVNFREVLEQSQRSNDYYQTQYRILQSRALARRTLEALNLWNDPQFNPARAGTAQGGTGERLLIAPLRAALNWVANLGATQREIEARGGSETDAQAAAVDRFLVNLTVAPVRNSRLVDVKFRSTSAETAAKVANAIAKGYIDQTLETRFQSSKEATDWLAEQLSEQRKQVEGTERKLQEYREQNDAVSVEDRQNIVVQKLADLNAAVTKARTERIQKEAAYNQIRTLRGDTGALETLPAIVSNTFVQEQKAELAQLQRQRAQLSEKLGPRHPDMAKMAAAIQIAQARIDAEIGKVIDSLRNDYQQAQAQEQSLSAALEQQKREALELNRKGIEYGALARDAAANRQVFESLIQRMKETGVSSELRTSNIRIVDEAEVPRRPAFPKKGTNFLIGLVAGLVLAVGFAFFSEYLDSRIKNPEEIRHHLGLPFLGMIPALTAKQLEQSGTGASALLNGNVPAGFAESFRTVRTNLLFSSADEGGRSIIVTSTVPGEGKTMVASNLAMALAIAGERVLLIDADMRRPRVHEVYEKPQKPGLSNILVGDAKASESVHKTTVPSLWILPAGECPPNPAELLGSRRFRDFLASLKQHFDWVIVDTPPVMAVTDSAVIAHRATGVLFVIGAEMTARAAAERAVEQLEHAKARFVGAVLNRVDLQRNSYYYSQYYRREYADYYRKASV